MAPQPRRESDAAAKVVLGLSKTLASALDLDEALTRVLDSIGLVIPLDSCSVFLLRGGSLEARAVKGAPRAGGLVGRLFDLDSLPLNRSIVEGGEAVVLPDVQDNPQWNKVLDSEASLGVRAWMGIPLKASGQVIGMLSIDSKTPGAYGEAELDVASSFADLAAIAVRNAQLFSETRRRLNELDAVNKVGAAVASRLDVDELCEVVGMQLQEIFRAGVVYVAVWEEEAGFVRVPFYAHDGKRESFGPFPDGEGLAALVLRELRTLYIAEDVGRAAPALGAKPLPGREPLSWLGVPILSGKRAFGVLCVQSYDREKAFSDDDVRLLTTIASTVGAGIRNARLYEEARRKAAEAAAIAEAGREIGESLDPDEVLRRIAQRAHSLLSRDTAAVFLAEPDGSLRAVVSVGRQAEELMGFRLPPGTGIVSRVVSTGEGVIVRDSLNEPGGVDVPGTPEEPGEKLMAAPLVVSARVAGVMAVWRGVGEPDFLPDDLVFLSGLARQAAVAIANARLHRRATEEARRSAALYESASAARAEAEEANRLKSRFLANMTHELRTPLNSIINLAYLIQEGEEDDAPAPEGIARAASRIEAAGRRLLELINEVLDLSRIEAGRMDVKLEPIDLRKAVSSALSEASSLARADGVELIDEMPEDLPLALADRVKVRQVLVNLLANAVKFTPSGSIRVRASASGDELLVEVEDTGIGMSPDEIPKAFAEFVQLDDDMDRRVGGSGLGLPLSRQLVELQGGRLWADSKKGAGSVFRFTLRRAEPPAQAARPSPSRSRASKPASARPEARAPLATPREGMPD